MTEAHVERQSSAIAALQSVDVETIFDKVCHSLRLSQHCLQTSPLPSACHSLALQDDFDAEKYINEMFPSGMLASEARCSANCHVGPPESTDLGLMP